MEYIEVELGIFKRIALDAERYGLSPEKVALLGVRLRDDPYQGLPDSSGAYVFYWKDWSWNDIYRVWYRRIDEPKRCLVDLIKIERVTSIPREARVWETTRDELVERLKSKGFDAVIEAAVGIFKGGA